MWALLQLSLRECSLCIKKHRIKKICVFNFFSKHLYWYFWKLLVIFKFVLSLEIFSECLRDSPVVYKQQCPVWKWIKNYSVVWLWGGEGPQTQTCKGCDWIRLQLYSLAGKFYSAVILSLIVPTCHQLSCILKLWGLGDGGWLLVVGIHNFLTLGTLEGLLGLFPNDF